MKKIQEKRVRLMYRPPRDRGVGIAGLCSLHRGLHLSKVIHKTSIMISAHKVSKRFNFIPLFVLGIGSSID